MPRCRYHGHRFPPEIIRQAVWLYLRFTLSFRDVEDLLAERGLDVSYETIRRWVLKFGPIFARALRRRRERPSSMWHLDEMVIRIGGERFWLWRAVDHEGEILDMLVQRRRDTKAALRLMRKLIRSRVSLRRSWSRTSLHRTAALAGPLASTAAMSRVSGPTIGPRTCMGLFVSSTHSLHLRPDCRDRARRGSGPASTI
jgi:transposase-like protein